MNVLLGGLLALWEPEREAVCGCLFELSAGLHTDTPPQIEDARFMTPSLNCGRAKGSTSQVLSSPHRFSLPQTPSLSELSITHESQPFLLLLLCVPTASRTLGSPCFVLEKLCCYSLTAEMIKRQSKTASDAGRLEHFVHD